MATPRALQAAPMATAQWMVRAAVAPARQAMRTCVRALVVARSPPLSKRPSLSLRRARRWWEPRTARLLSFPGMGVRGKEAWVALARRAVSW